MTPLQGDSLAALHDIHLPDAVSFWPLAAGWWLALALVIALAAMTHLYLRARRRSLKRAALSELAGIAASYEADADVSKLALQLSVLLRRVALMRFRRREVAKLHGDDWRQFLLRTGGRRGQLSEHASGLSYAIYAGRHAPRDESAPAKWIAAAQHWIRENT
jgi:hypothetical protein